MARTSKKEELYRDYAAACRKGFQLGTCEHTFAFDIDYKEEANKYSVKQLEAMLTEQQDKNQAKQAEIDAYWQSEEGLARKAQYDTFVREKMKEGDNYEKAAQYDIMKAIEATNIANVEVKRVDPRFHGCRIVLAIGNNSVEFRYDPITRYNDKEFTTNIRTAGTFDALDMSQDGEAVYYIAIGALLANQELLHNIKDIMKDVVEKFDMIEKEVRNAKEIHLTYNR